MSRQTCRSGASDSAVWVNLWTTELLRGRSKFAASRSGTILDPGPGSSQSSKITSQRGCILPLDDIRLRSSASGVGHATATPILVHLGFSRIDISLSLSWITAGVIADVFGL